MSHGYPQTFGAVTVGDVLVTNSTCGDDSAPYFILNAGCTLGIEAQVDFPAGSTAHEVSVENADMGCNGGNRTAAPSRSSAATGPAAASSACPRQAARSTSGSIGATGRSEAGSAVSGGSVVQRVYSASDDPLTSGPSSTCAIYDSDTLVDKHSTDTAPNDFIVKVGIQGSLEYASSVYNPS